MPKKTNIGISSNFKEWKLNLEEDPKRIQRGSFVGLSDLLEQGIREVNANAFIKGKAFKTKKGKKVYQESKGLNKENKNGEKVFHKTKITAHSMDSQKEFEKQWSQPNWKKGFFLWKASPAQDFSVTIKNEGLIYIGSIEITGKPERFYKNLHYGQKATKKNEVDLLKKDNNKSQVISRRRAVGNNLRKPVNFIRKVMKKQIDAELKKGNGKR